MNTTTTRIDYDFPIRALAPRTQPTRRPAAACDVDDLAERMVLGDGVALDALKRRFSRQLIGIVRDILGSRAAAIALVDDVFEDASREWPPERGRVRGWLLRLVRRAARRRLAVRGVDGVEE